MQGGGYRALCGAIRYRLGDPDCEIRWTKEIHFTSVQSSPGDHPPFPIMRAGGVSHLATGLSMSRSLSLLAPPYLRDVLLGDLHFYSDCTVVVYT